MKPHWNNEFTNFIGGWYMEDGSLCDRLINYFSKSEDTVVGAFANGGERIVNFDVKESKDLQLFDEELHNEYNIHLQECVDEYIELYKFSGRTACGWSASVEPANIQYYKPGGGYKTWHFERGNPGTITRNLVYMTYLNTVTDCGGTAFKYQNLEVQAEKGLTLIWPAEWTHTHKGIVSPTQEKYIITGWFNYVL